MPDTCEEPLQEGVPYHCRPSLSLGCGAMPAPSPVIPPPGCPPSDPVLEESFSHPPGRFPLWLRGARLQAPHLRGSSGRGGCIPKSKSCWVAASMDFFWPTARTFARMVSEGAGARHSAKMWRSKQASPTGMDKARKRCWARSSRPHHSLFPVAHFLCSSLSAAMAFNSFSC